MPGELGGKSYPIGYESQVPGEPFGHWTVRVEGGPAFASNAALACRIAEQRGAVGGDLFRRLAEAIEAAMAAEDAKVGLGDG